MDDTHAVSGTSAPTPAPDRKRKQPLLDGFDRALAALAGRGRLDQPYADDADRRMGGIQRPTSVAGRLARMRRSRPAPPDSALPLPAALSPPADDRACLAVDALFDWLDSIVLEDSVAWDAVDLGAAPHGAALTALVIAEWIDDCFCARLSERRPLVPRAPVAMCAAAAPAAPDKGAETGDFNTDEVAAAFWFMEQLEAGMCGHDTVRVRVGLDDAQGDAVCLRLAATSAVKHLAPDYEDVTEIFHDMGLGRAIVGIGKTYRSALRARLARLYATYLNLARAVDAARRAGFPAPPGAIPTPRSARSWMAACPDGAHIFAAMWSSSSAMATATTTMAMPVAPIALNTSDVGVDAPCAEPPGKRRRRASPRGGSLRVRRRPRRGCHQE
ncbi:hypothetical protein pkur_cds_832 [Pandoravirus kuranda]|uniref:Uncharacterized protein n=2 Tax=Pandoravirus TaxID=2060084 RepID=A0AA95EDJ2_9VIRU|nr:hypothetical protein pneo_cds_942 [Pandoravirus neocaledonia]AVK76549.1 hypothetical protein pneo_cds_942 [Pandoravirus neocaledonia]WBR15006.1 hypothetical protein pkur_cds_832 [Pandoravirus kuranda]